MILSVGGVGSESDSWVESSLVNSLNGASRGPAGVLQAQSFQRDKSNHLGTPAKTSAETSTMETWP